MRVLTFQTISTWRAGKEKVITLLEWAEVYCKGKVNHIALENTHQAFTFTDDADITIFTLYWK